MLLQSLVRVLCCPVVAPLFWSSVRFSPTGPVVSMVLFHWTLDVPTGSVVNYGICYIRQNVWFFVVLYCGKVVPCGVLRSVGSSARTNDCNNITTEDVDN